MALLTVLAGAMSQSCYPFVSLAFKATGPYCYDYPLIFGEILVSPEKKKYNPKVLNRASSNYLLHNSVTCTHPRGGASFKRELKLGILK
jgi:hypothetical protein